MRIDSASVANAQDLVMHRPLISPPAVDNRLELINNRGLRAVAIGLAITLSHLALAVGLLAPHGSIAYRYDRLMQHDSFWFANIVNRGYQTIVPPIDHKVMEVSNVGFFPAYPVLASALRYGLGLKTNTALLITAQAAAWGFWSYFFLFCERWNVSPAARALGALFVLAHPASFFLIAGYSESLFLMALLGFMYWSGSSTRAGRIWACLHGGVMSATRIVGIPCALYPVVQSLFTTGRKFLKNPLAWIKAHWQPIAVAAVSILGAGVFFVFCQLRWGHWDMYMLTQFSGWGIIPDYLAIFRPSSYRWLTPALNNPTEASQMTMTIGGLMLVTIALFEFIPALRGRTDWRARIGIYFCAGLIYFVSVSAVACVKMESMLRYEFCVHALIVLAFLHFLRQFRPPPVSVRALGVMVALASAAGLSVQGWYLWNFTRGNWIA